MAKMKARKEKKRPGPAPSGMARDKIVRIRFRADELATLEHKADENKTTLSELIRSRALGEG